MKTLAITVLFSLPIPAFAQMDLPQPIPAHVPPSMPPELVRYYLVDGDVGESGGISNDDGLGVRFGAYLTDHWREMVDRWPLVSMKEVDVSLFCGGAELMPSAEYVLFMDRMLTEYEKGRVGFYGAEAAMAPQGFKIGFSNVNYRHPDVRRVLQRYRSLLVAKKHPGTDWCDKILSGELEDQMDDLRGKRGYEILPLDVLPLSGGVKEHGYRVSPVKAVVATAKVFPQVVQTINWIEIVVLGVMAVAAAWLWRLWRRIRQRNASASSSSPP